MNKNLLFVHAHDMGRVNSAYGYATPTPNMASFAQTSCVFRDAHSAAPTCSPSRAAMWTGYTAHEMGMLGLVNRGFALNDRSKHLARHLSRQGFHTALAGLQHEVQAADVPRVYDEVLPDPPGGGEFEHRDERAGLQVEAFLQEPPTDRWMLSVGLFYPHRPFLSSEPTREGVKSPDPLPDVDVVRGDMADYHRTVEVTDRVFGRVLQALEASGQAGNTVVVLTTDHGIAFPEMKCNLTLHGTGVTLMIRDPGQPAPSRQIDGLVSHLDLPVTLCELLEVEKPAGGWGTSLVPLMREETSAVREDVFSEVTFHANEEPMRSVRTSTHTLIVRYDDDLSPAWANVDESPSKTLIMNQKAAHRPHPSVALYDRILDPQERVNRAEDPAYHTVRTDLEQRLHSWRVQTCDPLLEGPVAIPSGAKINPRNEVDPGCGVFV